ncbi:TetR family transcriptional regulator [Saccharopolyspora indica]|uniref:TetR/AcrR family transcriptional regulator n=1 Tax=Saccharopolyspora indica TaxID=1229659 RepID=UPI0022EAFBA0|nr:TetR/AcrR family transcriptional regulator [Saccharopolyspora indica]MDA3643084.1 TetR/AcrR family transcriptional regulator [Saccharopolyspora indica]
MTFTERGRRAQILHGAIDTIVELGWAQTSLIRIGERIGASKGAILHYFRDKDALVGHVVLEVNTRLADVVAEAIGAETTAAGRIRAYIRAYIDFIADNPRDIAALVELGTAYRHSDGRRLSEIIESAERWPQELLPLDLAGLLARERGGSQMHDVNPDVMAMIIRGAIDSAAERHARDRDFDPRPYGRELADMVESHLFPGTGARQET